MFVLVLVIKGVIMKANRLFVERLPKHPQYRAADSTTDRRTVRSKLTSIFDRAENIKLTLLDTYTEQYRTWVTADNEKVFLSFFDIIPWSLNCLRTKRRRLLSNILFSMKDVN